MTLIDLGVVKRVWSVGYTRFTHTFHGMGQDYRPTPLMCIPHLIFCGHLRTRALV